MGDRRAKFGPYVYTAELGTLRVAADCAFARWASVHEVTGTSHLVYQLLGPARDKFTIRKFLRAAEGAGGMNVPHARGFTSYALHASGTACLVTAYPGDLGGVTTLAQLVRAKGGRLGSAEIVRATEHLIDALASGEQVGTLHGFFDLDACIVDRAGRVAIELFGFGPHWAGTTAEEEKLRREQRRALAGVTRTLLQTEEAAGDGSAVGRPLSDSWEAWLNSLVQTGESARWEELKSTMPRTIGSTIRQPRASVVQSLWGKIKQIAGGAGG